MDKNIENNQERNIDEEKKNHGGYIKVASNCSEQEQKQEYEQEQNKIAIDINRSVSVLRQEIGQSLAKSGLPTSVLRVVLENFLFKLNEMDFMADHARVSEEISNLHEETAELRYRLKQACDKVETMTEAQTKPKAEDEE